MIYILLIIIILTLLFKGSSKRQLASPGATMFLVGLLAILIGSKFNLSRDGYILLTLALLVLMFIGLGYIASRGNKKH